MNCYLCKEELVPFSAFGNLYHHTMVCPTKIDMGDEFEDHYRICPDHINDCRIIIYPYRIIQSQYKTYFAKYHSKTLGYQWIDIFNISYINNDKAIKLLSRLENMKAFL